MKCFANSKTFLIGLEILLIYVFMNFRIPQDPKNSQINSKDIFYVLNNNFSYTQLPFLFLLQKDSYYVHDETDTFFFFLCRKTLVSFFGIFSSFSFSSSGRFLFLLCASF